MAKRQKVKSNNSACCLKALVMPVLLAAGMAVHAASGMNWEPSKPDVCRLMPGKGRNGAAAMAICGKPGARIGGSWRVRNYEYRPDTFYGMSYWVNRERTGSELVFENAFHWCRNRFAKC